MTRPSGASSGAPGLLGHRREERPVPFEVVEHPRRPREVGAAPGAHAGASGLGSGTVALISY